MLRAARSCQGVMTPCQSLAHQILPLSLAVGLPSAWLLPHSAECASQAASDCLALLPLKCLRCSKPDWQGESQVGQVVSFSVRAD